MSNNIIYFILLVEIYTYEKLMCATLMIKFKFFENRIARFHYSFSKYGRLTGEMYSEILQLIRLNLFREGEMRKFLCELDVNQKSK